MFLKWMLMIASWLILGSSQAYAEHRHGGGSGYLYTHPREIKTENHFAPLLFSNLLWNVRTGKGGPGPNNWSANSAFVDSQGRLHLRIYQSNGRWYCPEIVTTAPLGFGQYWFYVIGDIAHIDPNAILGLFNYTTPDVGPDGTNEIDIEFSTWGSTDPSALNSGYTVWPNEINHKRSVLTFNFTFTQHLKNLLQGSDLYSTNGFTWASKTVFFQSGYGHYKDYAIKFMDLLYAPPDYLDRIPQHPLPLHMNFWLLGGMAPMSGLPQEIIIKKFCFQPADGSPGNCPSNP